MEKPTTLADLWDSATPTKRLFDPQQLSTFPDPVRRYLEHAVAPGSKLSSAVHLRMHGQIKLGNWLPFSAEQVICWSRGMIWSATVHMHGLPIKGFDRIIDGEGEMRWKLFGVAPMISGSGPDITRSAKGRMIAESVWLPSVLATEASWSVQDSTHTIVRLSLQGETSELALAIDEEGRLTSVSMQRWGNPEGGEFREVVFGGIIEEEHQFGGYTIPSWVRIGWHYGTDRFESEGEFFRATVDNAVFR